MTAASRSLATALWGARFASGLLPQSYTTNRDTTPVEFSSHPTILKKPIMIASLSSSLDE